MSYENVTIEGRGHIAIVRVDRRGSLNAFNQATILELTQVARDFHDDLDARAVVLTSSTSAFSCCAKGLTRNRRSTGA